MISKFVSVKTVINKLYRDLGSNRDLPEEDIIEWCGEALGFIAAYPQYDIKAASLEVTNYKVKLPCDFVYLKDITYNGEPMIWASQSSINNYLCDDCEQPKCDSCYEYYIKDGYLYTSNIETTTASNHELCINYIAYPVDENGYPLIPDDVYYQAALTAYCTMRLDRIEFRKGAIAERVYRDSEQDWFFYVNSARGSANMPDVPQLENLKNIMQRLTPLQNEYKNAFRNLARQERKYIQ